MNGSILFNPDINIEVDVDPSAEEGARLVSAKNLVDGQELGIGGGSELPDVTSADEGKVLAVNASGEWAAGSAFIHVPFTDDIPTLSLTWKQIWDAISAGKIVAISNVIEGEDFSEAAINFICAVDVEEGSYNVHTVSGTDFTTNSENGYPHF